MIRRWALPLLVDLVFMAAGTVELILGDPSNPVLQLTLGSVAIAAILLRHRLPWAALVLTLPALADPDVLTPTLLVLFTVAQRTSRRRWMLGIASLAVIVLWLSPWDYQPRLPLVYDAIYAVMFGITPVALGQLVQTRRTLAARLDDVVRLRESEQRAVVERTRSEERARLAREMHDVVSHQVSLVAVQAGALQVSAREPETRRAARTIREICGQTLEELRQMLGVLRADAGHSGEIAPQPDLSMLPALVTASGIPVELVVDVPPGLGMPEQRALYRMVQEGLTNIRKHAPGATATISIVRVGPGLVLEVRNGTADRPPAALPSDRHGFIGLRERAELLGGTFAAGPTADGGFAMRVEIPEAGSPRSG